MKDLACQQFQDAVSEFLIRHQSILDLITKSQESNARVNRAIIKAVTNCGCVSINAKKTAIPQEASLNDLKSLLDDHLEGELCPSCRDIISGELGKSLFYVAALCHTLNLNLNEVMEQEQKKISTLRIFNFT